MKKSEWILFVKKSLIFFLLIQKYWKKACNCIYIHVYDWHHIFSLATNDEVTTVDQANILI